MIYYTVFGILEGILAYKSISQESNHRQLNFLFLIIICIIGFLFSKIGMFL